jgi:pSer/pThr/pTyr-binding forkhead associated (FHA) protein
LKIEFSSGNHLGRTFTLEKSGASIGRADDNDIVIEEAVVSRHHAKVEYREGNFIISDLSSANGTLINGRKITSHAIDHNDTFTIGTNAGTFYLA